MTEPAQNPQETKENPRHSQIYSALAAIMAEAGPVGKDSKNVQQGFNFRGIDAVMNHVHPLFAKHGVVVLTNVLDDRTEERQTKSGGTLIYRVLRIRFDFTASDGSTASSVVVGEGMDSGDKAANKAMAVGLKYALTQLLLLPYDEVDPDGESHEVRPKPASRPKAPANDKNAFPYADQAEKAASAAPLPPQKREQSPSGRGDDEVAPPHFVTDANPGHLLRDGTHWAEVEIHFGKNSGKALRSLDGKQINWYWKEWRKDTIAAMTDPAAKFKPRPADLRLAHALEIAYLYWPDEKATTPRRKFVAGQPAEITPPKAADVMDGLFVDGASKANPAPGTPTYPEKKEAKADEIPF